MSAEAPLLGTHTAFSGKKPLKLREIHSPACKVLQNCLFLSPSQKKPSLLPLKMVFPSNGVSQSESFHIYIYE